MSPAGYAGFGVGAVCALVLSIIAMLLLSRPNERPHDELAQRDPVSSVVDPPAPAPKPVTQEDAERDRAAALARRTKAIEDATVYLKLSSGGRLIGSGTGLPGLALFQTRRLIDISATQIHDPTTTSTTPM